MQQEDDLRGLAKVMEFMRAISIVFIVIHVYWFCYRSFVDMGINIGVVDRILLNFQRTVQQPAYNESICRHIPCPLMPGYPRSEKSGDDMGQDIRRFPFGIGAVFHELVDA